MSDQENQETAVINASSEELLRQAEEAKQREEQAAKEREEAERKACREYGVTLNEEERDRIDEYVEAQKDASRAFDDLDCAYDDLESYYKDKAEEYNHQCNKYNDALDELESRRENIDDIIDKFREVIEEETDEKHIPDPLRQLLVNAFESGEGNFSFIRPDSVEEYLEVSPPESELDDAADMSVHLDDLCKLLPMEELLTPEDRDTIASWGNNMSVWQVYDSLKDFTHVVKKSHLKYALGIYDPNSKFHDMLKEMAIEFGIND